MGSSLDWGSLAFQQVHRVTGTRHQEVLAWCRQHNKACIYGCSVLALAVALHFWCCDWRLPRWEYSPAFKREVRVSYDNELIWFMHAGSQFRTPCDEGAVYDLGQAFWWGLFTPLLMGVCGALTLAGQYDRASFHQNLCRRLAVPIRKHGPSMAATGTLVVATLLAAGTVVGGAVVVRVATAPTLVGPANDSYVGDLWAGADDGESWADWLAGLGEWLSSESPPPLPPPEPERRITFASSSSRENSFFQPVPEPSIMALLGSLAVSGLVFGAWRRWRKRIAVRRNQERIAES